MDHRVRCQRARRICHTSMLSIAGAGCAVRAAEIGICTDDWDLTDSIDCRLSTRVSEPLAEALPLNDTEGLMNGTLATSGNESCSTRPQPVPLSPDALAQL